MNRRTLLGSLAAVPLAGLSIDARSWLDGDQFVVTEENGSFGYGTARPGTYTPEKLAEEIELASGWPTRWDASKKMFVCDLEGIDPRYQVEGVDLKLFLPTEPAE